MASANRCPTIKATELITPFYGIVKYTDRVPAEEALSGKDVAQSYLLVAAHTSILAGLAIGLESFLK